MRGVVKSVNQDKAFGFVRGSDGVDYFFHARNVLAPALIDDFARGNAVEFDPTHHERGPRADGVHRVSVDLD